MQFGGTESFAATREQVWSFLIDPTRLNPCSPVPITRLDDRHFRAQLRVGRGFFSATAIVDIEVAEAQPLERVRIVARGGAAGTTAEATWTFTLRGGPVDGPTAGTTVVDWNLEVKLTGSFASAGEKAIAEPAPQAIERLVACIRQQIES